MSTTHVPATQSSMNVLVHDNKGWANSTHQRTAPLADSSPCFTATIRGQRTVVSRRLPSSRAGGSTTSHDPSRLLINSAPSACNVRAGIGPRAGLSIPGRKVRAACDRGPLQGGGRSFLRLPGQRQLRRELRGAARLRCRLPLRLLQLPPCAPLIREKG